MLKGLIEKAWNASALFTKKITPKSAGRETYTKETDPRTRSRSRVGPDDSARIFFADRCALMRPQNQKQRHVGPCLLVLLLRNARGQGERHCSLLRARSLASTFTTNLRRRWLMARFTGRRSRRQPRSIMMPNTSPKTSTTTPSSSPTLARRTTGAPTTQAVGPDPLSWSLTWAPRLFSRAAS